MVTLDITVGSTVLTLFSYYFEPSRNIDLDLHKISQVFLSKNLNRLVWCMDSNGKSELWFSPYSDSRGDKLSEFISANNLFVINEDYGPTFQATQGSSYIDVTVIGSDLLQDVSSWRLSEKESLSDHMMIEFEFCLSTFLRDTSNVPFKIFNTGKASQISIPVRNHGKHNVPWWSAEIFCMRKRLNASRRRFQRCKNPPLRELYKSKYLEYRKVYNLKLADAKSQSWETFLSTIDVHNVWKKIYTYGVIRDFMKKIEITGICLSTGETTNSLEETITAVLQKSFPSDLEESDDDLHKEYRQAARLLNAVMTEFSVEDSLSIC
ncbi:uncharacterized protein LOC118203047 [Stegodyphus dumicola]|uniref:uncharacterized protein LOC118203047 n=1 Tax=Stegodyphus dumicola TaxID=202533 RepID=UPI0015B12087|nr:uncharacterized protein LOC118203047 [Stegodyphus dumicola]